MGSDLRKSVVGIRHLEIKDAELIFQWRNSDQINELSSSQRRVTWEEHLDWINQSINNLNRLVYLIMLNDIAVGQLRFDRETGESGSPYISIYLVSEYTGQKLGGRALELGLKTLGQEWPECSFILAQVRVENAASIKFFQKHGFAQKNIIDGHFIFEFKYE